MQRGMIYLIHVLFVAPLFLYIGYYGKDTPDSVFSFLLILGAVVGLYHLHRYIKLNRALALAK